MIRHAVICSSSLKSCYSLSTTSSTTRRRLITSAVARKKHFSVLHQIRQNHSSLEANWQQQQQRRNLSTQIKKSHIHHQAARRQRQQQQPHTNNEANKRHDAQRKNNQQKRSRDGVGHKNENNNHQRRRPSQNSKILHQDNKNKRFMQSNTKHSSNKKREDNGINNNTSQKNASNTKQQQQQQRQQPEKDTDSSTTTTYTKLTKIMSTFLKRRQTIHSSSSSLQSKQDLYNDTLKFSSILQLALQNNTLPLHGKYSLLLNDLLTNLLVLYSEAPFEPKREKKEKEEEDYTKSPFEASMEILHLLQNLNLDIQPNHYHCTITSACHCENYKEGAMLFQRQIDVDFGGFVPLDGRIGGRRGDMMMDSDVGPVEMGLYAIAMAGREDGEEEDVASRVFEATMNMCMVSPFDEEKYILSAGLALGKAGAYQSCVDFLESGLHNERLGQPLVAATMLACVQSFQYKQALKVYQNAYLPPTTTTTSHWNDYDNNADDKNDDDYQKQQLVSGTEWQWGGKSNIMHPSCVDSALRAVGGLTLSSSSSLEEEDGDINDDDAQIQTWANSKHALQLFLQLINNQEPVSAGAIEGLFLACERDGDWRVATRIFDLLLDQCCKVHGNASDGSGSGNADNHHGGIWVVDDILTVSQRDDADNERGETVTIEDPEHIITGNMLASVMRTCNSNYEYGLSLMYARRLGLALSNTGNNDDSTTIDSEESSNDSTLASKEGANATAVNEPAEKSKNYIAGPGMATSQSYLVNHPNVLTAMMVSLCGLECYKDALELHDTVLSGGENGCDDLDEYWRDALHDCYVYAQDMIVVKAHDDDNYKAKAWESASKHLFRLSSVLHSIKDKKGEGYTAIRHPKGERVLANALARAMRICTEAGQPETALYVAQYAASIVKEASSSSLLGKKSSSSVTDAVKSFFGIGESSDGGDEIFSSSFYGDIQIGYPDFIMSTDSLLAATMEAYRSVDRDKDALGLFLTKYKQVHENESSQISDEDRSKHDNDDPLVHSTNEALRVFFRMDNHEDAKALFQTLDHSSRTPETYIIMAGGLVEKEQWSGEFSELYQSAVQSGCLTEELALLAMKSVVFSKLDGKMIVLRDIVDDISSILNITPEEFNRSRYWELKRALGYRFAKLLMWWNNLSSSWEKEFNLAARQLREGNQKGITIHEDALRCIVKFAGRDQQDPHDGGIPSPNADNDKDKRKRDEIKLIRLVLINARQTSLYDSPAFVDDVALGFRALKANDECIDFVKEIHLRDSTRIKQSTYEHAIHAAEEKNDPKVVEEMIKFLRDGCNESA